MPIKSEAEVQQIFSFWVQLGLRRQMIVILTTGVMFVAILAMSRMATAPTMSLLYSGLENGAAGDVVRALEQRGVPFEVRGGAIFVDAQARDELRLTLASEGLPANGNRGYELLDALTGFGTTSQMFDAAYWRAKEGELARTIVANPQIASARVHIANTGSNPFQRGVTPKASVSVTPRGSPITAAQAKAVRYLVASAVAGLSPDDVAVIDANGALLGQSDDTTPAIGGDDKAQVLRDRVARLLEARVGFGNAVVEISVDTITESETISERVFDPDSRVAISTETEERSTNATDAGGGDVTVASNLPDQENAAGEGGSSQNTESRERVNYEVSETEREIVRAAGAIKRVTVAVLVNDAVSVNEDGTVVSTPRDEAELEALRELVSSAVGFDQERGDIITIKSMPLQSVPLQGTAAETSWLRGMDIDLMSAIQMAILGLVTVILGLFVIRPVLSRRPIDTPVTPPALPGASSDSDSANAQSALTGEVSDDDFELPDLDADDGFPGALEPLPDIPGLNGTPKDPVDRLRAMIGDREEETIEILRGWLEDKEEKV